MWTSKHLTLVKPPDDESVEAAQTRCSLDTLRRLRGGWRPGEHLLAEARRAEHWSVTRRGGAGVYQFIGAGVQSPAFRSFTVATVLALDPEEGWGLLFGGWWVRLGEPVPEMPPFDAADVQSCAEDWLLSLFS
jgi:hypothetical protein